MNNEYVHIQEAIYEVIRDSGMPDGIAIPLADLIASQLQLRHGKNYVYIPETTRNQTAARDAAIHAMFNGRNIRDVMGSFYISKPTVYQACARHRARMGMQARTAAAPAMNLSLFDDKGAA